MSGVGPLIVGFLGVSGTFFGVSVMADLREVELLSRLRDPLVGGAGLVGFAPRREPATNGCRIANAGLRRRSGSHNRHFVMKSRKTSS